MSAFARFGAALALWLLVRLLLILDRLSLPQKVEPSSTARADDTRGMSRVRARYGTSTLLNFERSARGADS
ncbi:hypothetical protein QA648_09570 [Rhizobium sp. CB3171]|uniref:hypothetical protein n=1 Tax=Rhizobium sp. CB3171 TaxID=3039157 RepID=UPI000CDF55E7|nr:hypothetical protein [Rhizobium sp. CB3171]AVA22193.1 hypothetical protein NXC24_CH02558 [Rhizobium sp. NXC24]WFU03958.1 hypothetical protein QA648_09570 [Rhizobium sp. CB3171]